MSYSREYRKYGISDTLDKAVTEPGAHLTFPDDYTPVRPEMPPISTLPRQWFDYFSAISVYFKALRWRNLPEATKLRRLQRMQKLASRDLRARDYEMVVSHIGQNAFYTVQEIADILGSTIDNVVTLIRSGQLDAVELPDGYRILQTEFAAWSARASTQAKKRDKLHEAALKRKFLRTYAPDSIQLCPACNTVLYKTGGDFVCDRELGGCGRTFPLSKEK